MTRQIEFCVQFGDILRIQTDVVALKYAQTFYGVDRKIADRLAAAGLLSLEETKMQPGESQYIECHGVIRAKYALFIGTHSLDKFYCEDLRQWAYRVLATLKSKDKKVKHLSLTLHGRGFGLEPGAAFLALLTGLMTSIKNKNIPDALTGISIIENDVDTYLQLKELIDQRFFGEDSINPSPTGAVYSITV